MVLKVAVSSLPASFDVDFVDNLATFAASRFNGEKAAFVSRFSVTAKAAATTTSTKVSFTIADSATGATAQAIYDALAAAINSGTGSGTYLSVAESVVMTCSDGVERTTCSTTTPPTDPASDNMGAIIGGAAGGGGFVIIVILAILCYRKSRPPKIHDSSAATYGTTDTGAAGAVA